MQTRASKRLLQAIAVAAELTGTQLSEVAATVMAADLAKYPEDQILEALERCRRELKGRLTIADVIQRLGDGRPGPEQAWAMVPKSEEESAFWTEEMGQAAAVARELAQEGDMVAARMAFLEAYKELVHRARDIGRPVNWTFTAGTDKSGREAVILDALEKGIIDYSYARTILPYHREDASLDARLLALAEKCVHRLPKPKPPHGAPGTPVM